MVLYVPTKCFSFNQPPQSSSSTYSTFAYLIFTNGIFLPGQKKKPLKYTSLCFHVSAAPQNSWTQQRTVKLTDAAPFVFVIRFYCSWGLLSVYKTRADCKRPCGVREAGVSSVRFTSASTCCVSEMCSLQLHPVTFTVSLPSHRYAAATCHKSLFGWIRVKVIMLCTSL